MSQTCKVFISHISEESSVALVVKEAILGAFGAQCQVFVSSDNTSIAPGQGWYAKIVESLLDVDAVIVLLSQDSHRRPWINFEVGVGVGSRAKIIPMILNRFSASQLTFPLAGFKSYRLTVLGRSLT